MERNKTPALVLLALCFVLLLVFLYVNLGISPFQPSAYNTYTLQALAWRRGQAHLDHDVPHLELAIYQGRYYVSFPPVPTVPVYLLSFLFEDKVPDGLLVALYALIALLTLWKLLDRKGYPPLVAAGWALLLLCASSFLPLMANGAVWYQAQMMALMWIMLAIERMDRGKPTWGLLFYALSVGCRPFNVCYGPLLMLLYIRHQHQGGMRLPSIVKKLLPGILAGLFVAFLYGLYNALRFANPLEFGHNHLPEFSFQGGIQFSLTHLGNNISTYIFGLPYQAGAQGLELKKFGFSLFLANPALLLMLVWAVALAVKRRFTWNHGLILIFFSMQLFGLLLHRTFGGFQFGARYAADLIPYAALFLLYRQKKAMTTAEAAVMLTGLVFSIYGSLMIHLPG